jgi:endonuclease YncB( thermonuclease family)
LSAGLLCLGILYLGILCLGGPLLSGAASAEPAAKVAEVADGAAVLDDGRRVHLAGVRLPPPGWPHAQVAAAVLRRLLAGRTVTLTWQAPPDRHGRVLAHLRLEDGTWVQGALLERGVARVHTTPATRELAAEMLAIEREARRRRIGLWRYDAYRIHPADGAGPAAGTFQLVQGEVAAVSRRGRRAYLNFGPDWRDDFTASIPASALPAFRDAGLDPLELAGRRIRVRGWVHPVNGPAIELTHPEQIEILADGEPLYDGARSPH